MTRAAQSSPPAKPLRRLNLRRWLEADLPRQSWASRAFGAGVKRARLRLDRLRLEAVAFASHSDNVAGQLRIILKLLPQPCDVNIYRARSDKRLVVPYAG